MKQSLSFWSTVYKRLKSTNLIEAIPTIVSSISFTSSEKFSESIIGIDDIASFTASANFWFLLDG